VRLGSRVMYTPGRLAARVAQMGKAISRDYRGRDIDVIVILENGFMFAADLVREIDVPVVCHFVREVLSDVELSGYPRREVYFTQRPVLKGRDVLLVDAVLATGVPQDFLVRRLLDSEPRSLKLAVLLDKPKGRKVSLNADYIGFVTASNDLVGYGLSGSNGHGRNLPYIAAQKGSKASRRGGKRRAKSVARRSK